ncbi:PopZ family protein [Ochrobactrum quorumnocens]|jgi:cell pole-organizing protein PopZ|uniref:DUF2497 domain-containing protein n=1 Tax=Ochrobactrum quorumnocens TaxID=271865 RepID=A0A248UHY8_9HYPH|nr:PopZ family protein [[Ochrobactrum] quorumnocens]ASV86453.1 hypothetical protein CES85_1012 [[Ochrobactrum] quorumnocens]KAA9366507.1 DUF2497 domain-containing protein [[Ochrobactrum] quorumnocens]MBD7992588.1 DUF2497 domain-containing protein [Ochrobactrum gallinarum]
MAQTSSAAREPSMEEILASIRRIIEDSDVSRHPMPAASAFPSRGEVAKFRKPVTAQESQPEAADKPALKSDAFLDDTVLRGPLSETPSAVTIADEIPDADEEEDDFVLDAQNDDHRGEVVEPVAEVDTAPSLEAKIAVELDTAQPDETSEPEVEATPVAEAQPADLKAQGSAHILSEGTERKVAAAFQDLNHAVHSEPRRSFDEIASDLLRPMLQSWLDDNLPPLVERLVREEIERVVRGER